MTLKTPRIGLGITLLTVVCGSVSVPAAPQTVSGNPAANLGASGQGIYVQQPDPKHPGRPLWKIWARGFTGGAQGTGFAGSLSGVSATLFQNGRAAATLAAPQARGDSGTRIITATGRVTVRSLATSGTLLQADRVLWYGGGNKVVASGHVFYRDGKTGTTIQCPQLVADTVLKTIRSSGAGSAKFPKGF